MNERAYVVSAPSGARRHEGTVLGIQRSRIALAAHSSELLLAVAVALVACAMLMTLPNSVAQDTWLALVAGREIWQAGLPIHDTLTGFSHGAMWVDQQWLSQLSMYSLWRLDGMALVGVVQVILSTSAVVGAVVAARRLGASAASVIRAYPIAIAMVIFSLILRTQAYAYPCFVATVVLLSSDSHHPGRHVYWCLPLLVIWANLHGSASLGAGLVALRGLTLAWERRTQLLRTMRAWRRPVALAVGAPLALLVTPYGISAVSYYRGTLLNPGFRKFVTEWQPVTSSALLAVGFFAMAGVTLWSIARRPDRTSMWERLALLALAAGAIIAVRNVPWFGLAALVLLPVSMDGEVRARARTRRSHPGLNVALAILATLALVVATANALARGPATFERNYPRQLARVVEAAYAADPSLRVAADERFADWLLWYEPNLRGRIAYDVRFELLTTARMEQIGRLQLAAGLNWKRPLRGYRLVVVDKTRAPLEAAGFEAEPGHHVLYDRSGTLVVLRDAKQATL